MLSSTFFLQYQQGGEETEIERTEFNQPVDLKLEALKILQTKCNVCHRTKNPRKVFTLDNMHVLAPKIHKQVFIKRRMPKGREIRLSSREYDVLENWLLTLNIK